MMKKCLGAVLLVLMVMLAACDPTLTETEVSWHDPSFNSGPFEKVLVIGVSQDLLKKKAFEDIFSAMLRDRGVEAITSYTVMPTSDVLDKAAIKKAIEGLDVDGVFLLQSVGSDTTTEVVPGYTVNESNHRNRYNFYNYYSTTNRSYSVPPQEVEVQNVYIDSKMFEVSSEKLIWQKQIKLINPKDFANSVKKVGKPLLKSMAKNNVIK